MTQDLIDAAELLGSQAAKHLHEVVLPEGIDMLNGFTREEAKMRSAWIAEGKGAGLPQFKFTKDVKEGPEFNG